MKKLTILITACALSAAPISAQFTKDGTALTWNKELLVVSDKIVFNKQEFPAHTITVFEGDAKMAMDLWKTDLAAITTSITGSKPAKAEGVRIPAISDAPLTVFALVSAEKKAKLARVTLAFALNDTTPLLDEGAQEKWMREFAVRLNKAVVQAQIDRYQKELDKATDKLGSSQGDLLKTEQSLRKSTSDLDKLSAKRGKLEVDRNRQMRDVEQLEAKYARTNEPKDLKKLISARSKLTKNETNLAKLGQQEAKIQATISKTQGTLDSRTRTAEVHAESKGELYDTITSLKAKLQSIQ